MIGQDTWSYSQVGAGTTTLRPAASMPGRSVPPTSDGNRPQPTFPRARPSHEYLGGSSSTTKSVATHEHDGLLLHPRAPHHGRWRGNDAQLCPTLLAVDNERPDPATRATFRHFHDGSGNVDVDDIGSFGTPPAGGRRSAPEDRRRRAGGDQRPDSGSPVPLLVGAGVVAALHGGRRHRGVASPPHQLTVVRRRSSFQIGAGIGFHAPSTRGSWWIWALGLAAAVSHIPTNPVCLLLVLGVLAFVVPHAVAECSVGPGRSSTTCTSPSVVAIRVIFRSVLEATCVRSTRRCCFTLPHIPLPLVGGGDPARGSGHARGAPWRRSTTG